MARSLRRAAVAAGGAFVLAGSLFTGTAGAADETTQEVRPTLACGGQSSLADPNLATSTSTPRSTASSRGTAQVRAGYVNGVQYGWARALNSSSSYYVRFEVDINGDRVWDCAATRPISSSIYWTSGTRTSSSSNVAFRACITNWSPGACVSPYVTSWW
ncbi:hypothetical protein [Streptomyces sp. NPDC002845]